MCSEGDVRCTRFLPGILHSAVHVSNDFDGDIAFRTVHAMKHIAVGFPNVISIGSIPSILVVIQQQTFVRHKWAFVHGWKSRFGYLVLSNDVNGKTSGRPNGK